MTEMGRKDLSKWPSRIPVWTLAALFVTPIFFAAMLTLQWLYGLSFAEKLYLGSYMKGQAIGQISPASKSRYELLEGILPKGKTSIVTGDEAEMSHDADGRILYRLTDEGVTHGLTGLKWEVGVFNDLKMSQFLAHEIYQDQSPWDYLQRPAYASLIFSVMVLFFGIVKDSSKQRAHKNGRRLRGPELVTTAEFNKRLGVSTLFRSRLPDGISLINLQRSWGDRVFRSSASGWARIPRDSEASHFLIVGDSGTGKSAAIRQILAQIWERGEAAVVYDPAMEYLPQFFNASRGDVILNPLDARCPFWSPGDEVPHAAEALTLATSLFPDQGRENRFFVEAPRKIFAHLLNLKPTPEELTRWMCRPEEIDKRVEGTELESMIDRQAAAQRSGVLGSLNMVADAFKLLPKKSDANGVWNTVEWAKERKGWIFLTSKPTMRETQRPLISLWLDLLVLRLMNDGVAGKRKTWFVLDELASLQRLPQLTTAITENRKSNNPMVLGFQGKAQIESLYGHVTEALLSQPATKIFLRTSEPMAAEWISKAIGEVEVERIRESRTHGRFPNNSRSDQRDTAREPMIMASEIAGLDPLHGCLKVGNLVLPMRFPYLEFQSKVEKFVERKPKAATIAAVIDTVPPADHDTFEKELRINGERKPPTPARISKERCIEANGTSIHFD